MIIYVQGALQKRGGAPSLLHHNVCVVTGTTLRKSIPHYLSRTFAPALQTNWRVPVFICAISVVVFEIVVNILFANC